jgi:hypothetical protein
MKRSGALVGNSLVSFSADVAQQDREDMVDCLLRVDRLAGQVSREANFSYWTYRYGKGLEQRGCIKSCAIIHQPIVITSAKALENTTFEVIRATGASDLARQAVESLQALKVQQLARHFFESGSGQGDFARFQVVPCLMSDDGELIVVVSGIQLSGEVSIRDFDFWTQTSPDMVLRISGGAYRFDRDAYAGHRARIKRELGEAAEQSIETFSL